MNEEFDYSNIDLNSAASELYGDVTPTTPVAPKAVETPVETKENEVETEENDNPFEDEAETKVDETPEEVDPDEELSRSWKLKRSGVLSVSIRKSKLRRLQKLKRLDLKAEIEALKSGSKAPETNEAPLSRLTMQGSKRL